MIRGFLTGTLLVITFSIIYLIIHLGLLKSVNLREDIQGPFHLLYQQHQGPYYQISEVIMNVEKIAKENGLDCVQAFGEFFDNPNEVDEDRLRSRGGCISRSPYPHVPEGTETDQIPEQRFVVAEFSGSPAVGPWKVYSKAQAYIENHRLHSTEEAIEIYTPKNGSIETTYLFPLK